MAVDASILPGHAQIVHILGRNLAASTPVAAESEAGRDMVAHLPLQVASMAFSLERGTITFSAGSRRAQCPSVGPG